MDNATSHTSKKFMNKFTKEYQIIYNSPYTPELNAIEYSFGKIKNIFRRF